MVKTFLAATANYDDFLNISSGEVNKYVIKSNEAALRKAFSFFQNSTKILIITGFSGTGKKQICEHTTSFLDKETVISSFFCTKSTHLDDVHLMLYKNLLKKTSVKEKQELETVNEIKEKNDLLISTLKLKHTFVFHNFDDLTDENRKEILNFIYSFNANEYIKIVLTAKTFDTELIPEDVTYTKIMTKALTKDLFESYLKEFGIKITNSGLDQLYRLTRGYFLHTCLSCKIMINRELNINDFIIEYSNSGDKFDDFLAKFYCRLIVGTTKSAFNVFVQLRHGINLKCLQSIGSYPEIIFKTLSDNYYIIKKGDLYYPLGFLKNQLYKPDVFEIKPEMLTKYYEKQLELSQQERDFTISRVTLQSEINFYNGRTDEPSTTEEVSQNGNTQPKEEQTTIEESEQEDLSKLSLSELFERAQKSYIAFDYLNTIDALNELLDRKDKNMPDNILYPVYNLLAKTYVKLNKWKYALYFFNLLKDYYKKNNNILALHRTEYEICNVYYQSYQIKEAILAIKQLIAVTKDNQLVLNCNVLLGNIALSISNKDLALQYYEDGILHVDENSNKTILIELFFKYAILSDEKNDLKNAIDYYQKCINIQDISSKYTALAYSNLGDMFYDNDLINEAKDCFEKAYNTDKSNNNEYGMYYSLSKILELMDKNDTEAKIKTAEQAQQHAINSGDAYSVTESTIKLGDTCYEAKEYEKSLNVYLDLYKVKKDILSEHNLKILRDRIEDVRACLGKEKFEELAPDYE